MKVDGEEGFEEDHVSVVIKLDDLRRTLLCRICNDFYKSPHIITGCFCTFCYQCLHERMKNGLASCPSCKITFDLFATGQTLPDQNLQAIVDHIRPYFSNQTTEAISNGNLVMESKYPNTVSFDPP